MKKLLHMLMVSSLLFIIGFGDVSRASASANEIPPEAFLKSEDPLLDSEELIFNLAESVSAFALVEMYAQNAMIQTQMVFEQLEEISRNVDVVQPLDTHLEDVNTSAKRWLDDLKPQLQKTTQNIISFTDTFEGFTDPLMDAIEEDNQEDFLYVIQYLEDQVDKNEIQTQRLTDDLVTYADELEEIVGNLSSDYEKIQTHLEGEDSTIAVLRKELDDLEHDLNLLIAEIVLLSLGTLGTTLGVPVSAVAAVVAFKTGMVKTPIIGIPLLFSVPVILGITSGILAGAIAVKAVQIDTTISRIRDKTEKLGKIESEYAVLSHINTEIETIVDHTMDTHTATQSLQDSWMTMKTKFVTLRESIDYLDWEKAQPLLLDKIEVTDKEAQDLNEYAKQLQLEYEVIIEEPEE